MLTLGLVGYVTAIVGTSDRFGPSGRSEMDVEIRVMLAGFAVGLVAAIVVWKARAAVAPWVAIGVYPLVLCAAWFSYTSTRDEPVAIVATAVLLGPVAAMLLLVVRRVDALSWVPLVVVLFSYLFFSVGIYLLAGSFAVIPYGFFWFFAWGDDRRWSPSPRGQHQSGQRWNKWAGRPESLG